MSETNQGQIVAMGGGGFSMEPENWLLDDFVLSLCPRKEPKVCFVPTAAADSPAYLVRFYRAFSNRSVIPTDLTLFESGSLSRNPARSSGLADFVAEQDIIYVGGGNTANLLSVWRAHGLDEIFKEAWLGGKIFCGLSAGMICWFKTGVTDSFGELSPLENGLGWIDASACPHYDSEPARRLAFHEMIRNGMPTGFAADDGAALHFVGTELAEVVSSRAGASAYRVEKSGAGVSDTKLPCRFLGSVAP